MKYQTFVDINKPIDEVTRLFDNPDTLHEWMRGLESFEPISGTPGEPGAKSKLHFKMGKRKFELIETIVEKDLPRVFSGTYEHKGTFNVISNSFEAIDEKNTRMTAENEFRFSGFMKVMAFFHEGIDEKNDPT